MVVYRCPICGRLHTGEIDFHFCPICSAPAETFSRECGVEHYANWDVKTRLMISHMAETGHYLLDGKGTTRRFRNMDDLIFLPAQVACLPLLDEEPVSTAVVLGKESDIPIPAKTPVLIAGMSFGALSREAKMALALASATTGSVADTGEGGMLDEERLLANHITLQYATGRFGITQDRLKMADMVEIKLSQGAKPAMGGKLPGEKVTAEIAAIRRIPPASTIWTSNRSFITC